VSLAEIEKIFQTGGDPEQLIRALDENDLGEIEAIYREWLVNICGDQAEHVSDRAVAITMALKSDAEFRRRVRGRRRGRSTVWTDELLSEIYPDFLRDVERGVTRRDAAVRLARDRRCRDRFHRNARNPGAALLRQIQEFERRNVARALISLFTSQERSHAETTVLDRKEKYCHKDTREDIYGDW
jgi:hypothetical protein